jgi:diamine N-acetyltransferase
MIDQRWQSMGFGAQALRLLIDHARAVPGTRAMLLSFVEGEASPEAFYRRFGFERTGEVSEGEHVMRLAF